MLWSLALIGSILDWSLEQVVIANIAKLRKRYPDGFDTAHSIHREQGA
jgi:hypothetical protein